MPEGESEAQAQKRLGGYLVGYHAAMVASVGLRAELFEVLAEAEPAGLSEGELADKTGYEPRYVGVWCRAAYAHELIDWDDSGRYHLPAALRGLLLDPAHPRYLGGAMRLGFTEDYRAFPKYLRDGGTWPRSEHDPELLDNIAENAKTRGFVLTRYTLPVAPELQQRLEQGGTILDIGCGGGNAAIHYAQTFPRAHIVGLEIDPAMLEQARRQVAEAGLGERIELRDQDANTLDEQGVYDLVTLNVALHETGGPAEYRNVLARARQALAPGGSLLVVELPYPGSPREYRERATYRVLAGIQVHEALVGCGMITIPELRDLLTGTGFTQIERVEQPNPAQIVVLARG